MSNDNLVLILKVVLFVLDICLKMMGKCQNPEIPAHFGSNINCFSSPSCRRRFLFPLKSLASVFVDVPHPGEAHFLVCLGPEN